MTRNEFVIKYRGKPWLNDALRVLDDAGTFVKEVKARLAELVDAPVSKAGSLRGV